jgi:hypothetical protein
MNTETNPLEQIRSARRQQNLCGSLAGQTLGFSAVALALGVAAHNEFLTNGGWALVVSGAVLATAWDNRAAAADKIQSELLDAIMMPK